MKYLFFDIECANCYTGKGKIYSFGYVLTDENFNVIGAPEDILMNPDSNFDPYVRKKILAYDKKMFKSLPKFDEIYPTIKNMMTAEDTLCFGYGIQNDLHFLEDDCNRYGLPIIEAKTFDIQRLIEIAENEKAKKLDAEYTERTGKEERGTHRSDEDAVRTAEIAKSICLKQNKKLHEYFLEKDGTAKDIHELIIVRGERKEKPFAKAEWIWAKSDYAADDYAEFKVDLPKKVKKTEKVVLRYSSDSCFAAFIGEKLVAFSQCADLPDSKYYDSVNLSGVDFSKADSLTVRVWHFGVDSANYIAGSAGVIFELECDGEIVAYSNENTPSRVMSEYKNEYKKVITGQLGFSFLYDLRVVPCEFLSSVKVDKPTAFYPRLRKNLEMASRSECGVQRTEKSVIIDLYAEMCGFLDIDVVSSKEIKLKIAYGEHLYDIGPDGKGHVRSFIGGRDFTVEVVLKKGENRYLNPFRRIAGRYLEVFAEVVEDGVCDICGGGDKNADPFEFLTINYIGLRRVYYPVNKKELKFRDPLIQKITDVCVNTLTVCMHEHYEDCAWREQGLYSLDSRNQALCGYYAFRGHEYQRSNIVLLARGLRKDGLLSLTVPGGVDIPIPFFSLAYFQTVYEYIEHTGDRGVLNIVAPALNRILAAFESKICDNGLIARFSAPPYWNFYEWTDGMDSIDDLENPGAHNNENVFDATINLAFVIALFYYDKIFGTKHDTSAMKTVIRERFYDEKSGRFVISDDNKNSSQFVTALAILAGIGDRSDAEKMLDGKQIAASLSTKAYVYDALLSVGGYGKYIIEDIRRVYGKMLDQGATSVWETEKGADDFGGAGSLCHGWSAIPVYYFSRILLPKRRFYHRDKSTENRKKSVGNARNAKSSPRRDNK